MARLRNYVFRENVESKASVKVEQIMQVNSTLQANLEIDNMI